MTAEELRAAFDTIHASDELKEKTCKAILLASNRRVWRRNRALSRGLAAACCLLLALWCGYYFALEPVAAISVDVNPSLQLSINRLDRVISLEGYNEDGQRIAQGLHVTMDPYPVALEKILDSGEIQTYLMENEAVSITVSAADQLLGSQILEAAVQCAAGHHGVYCGAVSQEEADAAQAAGLSMGRYRAFLQLQALDATITIQDIQDLSMGELWDWIASLQAEEGPLPSGSVGSGSHHGYGNGWQQGHRGGLVSAGACPDAGCQQYEDSGSS